jgi:predicted membrane channel-forming protein YqfA (hemolysin III family)
MILSLLKNKTMRILKFLFLGFAALFVVATVVKMLFFLAITAAVLGGVALLGRGVARHFQGDERMAARRAAFHDFLKKDDANGYFPTTFDRPAFPMAQYPTIEII